MSENDSTVLDLAKKDGVTWVVEDCVKDGFYRVKNGDLGDMVPDRFVNKRIKEGLIKESDRYTYLRAFREAVYERVNQSLWCETCNDVRVSHVFCHDGIETEICPTCNAHVL